MAAPHPLIVRETARQLRSQGWTLAAIAKRLCIGMSTVSPWVADIRTSSLIELMSARREAGRLKGSGRISTHFADKRQEAFEKGASDVLSRMDALAVGLYWGEGNKKVVSRNGNRTSARWGVTNMEAVVLKICLEWAKRYGQPLNQFVVEVYAHKTSTTCDEDIVIYWSSHLGVETNQVRVYRKYAGDTVFRTTRWPFSVGKLVARKNAVYLLGRLMGQMYPLTGEVHPAASALGIKDKTTTK